MIASTMQIIQHIPITIMITIVSATMTTIIKLTMTKDMNRGRKVIGAGCYLFLLLLWNLLVMVHTRRVGTVTSTMKILMLIMMMATMLHRL
jgi:hypothetical protein